MQTNGFPLSLDHEPLQLKATPPLRTHTVRGRVCCPLMNEGWWGSGRNASECWGGNGMLWLQSGWVGGGSWRERRKERRGRLSSFHLENHCSRGPLKISDTWALQRHPWENGSLKEVGSPAVALSLRLKSQPFFLAVLCDLAQFGWDCGLRVQKEDPPCVLSPHSHGQTPSKRCLLPS